MRYINSFFLCFFLVMTSGCFQFFNEPETDNSAIQFTASPSEDWEQDLETLLQTHVNDEGLVDYAGLLSKKETIESIIVALKDVNATQLTQAEQLAFWFNTYNILMFWNILSKYPAIKDGLVSDHNDDFFKSNFFDVGGTVISLDELENRILRKDPAKGGEWVRNGTNFSVDKLRVELHIALSCAAQSCPPLLNTRWKAESIEEDMINRMKTIFNKPSFMSLENGKPSVSTLVDWFNEDFKVDGKTVGEYLASLLTDDKKDLKDVLIEAGNDKSKLSFKPYDWKLNHQ